MTTPDTKAPASNLGTDNGPREQAQSQEMPPVQTGEERLSEAERVTVQTSKGEPAERVEQASGVHRYLVCQDLNDKDTSQKVLHYTKDRLVREGDKVTLFTCLPPWIVEPSAVALGLSDGLIVWQVDGQTAQLRKGSKEAHNRLRAMADQFPANVEVHTYVAFGAAEDEIIAAAKSRQADMIVVGRRKIGPFHRLFSAGRTSNSLVANADTSVLVVR